ncbi:AraC family transcriptional regulator [Ruania suaedae]|uniref:AraC family transcriptional regulator n=1 Tax=Ruania suaedae TaxID=2897774 RepID=UPI001E39B7AD|nr:AraC family transcriptional regulator [Ruania suaedae]UFU02490.1 AraC family transcriptional regulator [Ruania suaedae]
MDVVAALLDGPRAQRAFLLKAMFGGRWSIGVEDQAALSVIVVVHGSAVVTSVGEQRQVVAEDVVLIRGPRPYVVADAASTPVGIRILPGQVCVDSTGQLLEESMHLGVRTWGNTTDPEATTMLIGTYAQETSVGAHVLSHLPEVLVLSGLRSPVIEVLEEELVTEAPGQVAVLDRLLDLVLVHALRFAYAGELMEGWPAAQQDPVISRALGLIHERPEQPWTVAALAGECALSRAAFARRFAARVGEPPLAYLTRWRLVLAADLLTGTDLTLAAIAGRVGYANAFTFSAAFKRVRGVAPARFRADAAVRE